MAVKDPREYMRDCLKKYESGGHMTDERIAGHLFHFCRSAGTFNIAVHRPGFACRINKPGEWQSFNLLDTGIKIVYSTTAFFMQVSTDSTSSGYPYLELELADA